MNAISTFIPLIWQYNGWEEVSDKNFTLTFKPAIMAGHGDPAGQWMEEVSDKNFTLTFKPAIMAGHGDPAGQWMEEVSDKTLHTHSDNID